MALSLDEAKDYVTAVFQAAGATHTDAFGLTATFDTKGKVYEAFCLAEILVRLKNVESLIPTLVNGPNIALRSSGGPINAHYPHVALSRHGIHVADVWTDIEFMTLSSETLGVFEGDRHELDIVVVDVGSMGYPSTGQLWLGVECKNTSYKKRMVRETLGVRRELGLLQGHPLPTEFGVWPLSQVRFDPPSALLVMSTDPKVATYGTVGTAYGIRFEHKDM